MNTNQIHNIGHTIWLHVARTLYAVAWSERHKIGLSDDVFNILPNDIPDAAGELAKTICTSLLIDSAMDPQRSGVPATERLGMLFTDLNTAYVPFDADRDLTPELFGHYLALHALGIGAGIGHFGVDVRGLLVVKPVVFNAMHLAPRAAKQNTAMPDAVLAKLRQEQQASWRSR